MPIYCYRCSKCGQDSEIIHKSTDNSERLCEVCHGHMERIMSPVAVIFKGSGFHKNDYTHGSNSGQAATPAKSEASPAPPAAASNTAADTSPKSNAAQPAAEVAKSPEPVKSDSSKVA